MSSALSWQERQNCVASIVFEVFIVCAQPEREIKKSNATRKDKKGVL